MKKLGGLLITIGTLAGVYTVVQAPAVVAAGCANVSTFGAVTLEVPDLPDAENHALWVRMESPQSQSYILVQINDEQCLQVGGFEQVPGQWSWQSYRLQGVVQPIVFHRTSGNSLKLIGVADGAKVDRVLITEADCIPQDFGANCQPVQAVHATGPLTQLPPPSNDPIAGKVHLSQTPQKHAAQLSHVAYVVNGQKLQETQTPEPFDTTRTTNGKQTVEIVTTLKDGQAIRESTVVDIQNPENAFSPLVRWVRLHKTAFVRAAGAAAVILLVFATVRLMRSHRRKGRESKFHGF